MFETISVQNFRRFKTFRIGELDQVNLLTGRNNVGKTALLEAIFLLVGGANVNLVAFVSAFRGLSNFVLANPDAVRNTMWGPLFFRFDTNLEITIEGQRHGNERHKVQLDIVPTTTAQLDVSQDPSGITKGPAGGSIEATPSFGGSLRQQYTDPQGNRQEAKMVIDTQNVRVEPPANPWIPGVFMPARGITNPQEDAERFGHMELDGRTGELLEALKIIEPDLKRLTTIVNGGVVTIYGDVGMGRMVPVPLMGDGIGRLATVLLAIAVSQNGVVLVDEVDIGLHHSVLGEAWKVIIDAAHRYNVQIFATTHSFEFIQAAYGAFETSQDIPFRLHRLEQNHEGVRAISYDDETLAAAMDAEFEVR